MTLKPESALDVYLNRIEELQHLNIRMKDEEDTILESKKRLFKFEQKIRSLEASVSQDTPNIDEVYTSIEKEISQWRLFHEQLKVNGDEKCEQEKKKKVSFHFKYSEIMKDRSAHLIGSAKNHKYFEICEGSVKHIFPNKSWWHQRPYYPPLEGICYYDTKNEGEVVLGSDWKSILAQHWKLYSTIGKFRFLAGVDTGITIFDIKNHYIEEPKQLNPYLEYAKCLETKLKDIDELLGL